MACFSSTCRSCTTSLGLLGMPEERRHSEVSSSGLGDPRAARTARAMVQSISSAKLEGYHLQSPDVFITPVGKVNWSHRKVFFLSGFAVASKSRGAGGWEQSPGGVKPSGRHAWPVLTFPLARQLTEG